MNTRILFMPILLLLASGCEKPAQVAHPNLEGLVGIWQDSNLVAAGWSDVFRFFPNGEVRSHKNQMDCESRSRGFLGTWDQEGDTLVIDVTTEEVIVGGQLVEAMGSCATNREIEGGTIQQQALVQPKRITQKVAITIDRGMNAFGDSYDLKMVELGGKKYWKLEDDPSKY